MLCFFNGNSLALSSSEADSQSVPARHTREVGKNFTGGGFEFRLRVLKKGWEVVEEDGEEIWGKLERQNTEHSIQDTGQAGQAGCNWRKILLLCSNCTGWLCRKFLILSKCRKVK